MDIARQPRLKLSKPVLLTLGGLATAALLAFGASAFGASGARVPSVERSSVWTERVARGDFVRQAAVQGTLVPEHVQWLSAVSAARVAHIVLRAGAEVEPDSVVVVLENADLELAALEADQHAATASSALMQLDVRTRSDEKLSEANLALLQTDLRDAENHARAADRLAPAGLMSDLDHRDATSKAAGLGARVKSEQARYEALRAGRDTQLAAQRAEVERLREISAFRRRQLKALEVRAGVRGIVQDVPLENGQWVAIGTVLAKVAEPLRLKAEVRVAEGDAKDVQKGLPVVFNSPAGPFRGKVDRVDPAVVAGSVRLEVTFDEQPKDARADQSVSGFVEIDRVKDVLHVARPSAVQEGQTAGIFRLEHDGVHAQRVAARFGRGSAKELIVEGGLEAGDEIVVSDSSTWESRIKLK